MPASFRLLQIAYSAETLNPISPDFAILNNLDNAKPEWYELWPMLQYLNATPLDDDCWLGFFSPKFHLKTGWTGWNIKEFTLRQSNQCEAVLFGQAWDQIAYFRNVFEQGEYWHPGLTEISEEIYRRVGLNVNLKMLVNHTGNACFSNFIVAKPTYWKMWAYYANRLFEFIENDDSRIGKLSRGDVSYGAKERLAPIRTFIQERLHAILLNQISGQVVTFERVTESQPFERLFEATHENSLKLKLCDIHKRLYLATGKQEHLDAFYGARRSVKKTDENMRRNFQ